MTFKQIVGWVMLIGFSGFMIYKFYHFAADQNDAPLIILLAIVILLFLILIIRKIVREA